VAHNSKLISYVYNKDMVFRLWRRQILYKHEITFVLNLCPNSNNSCNNKRYQRRQFEKREHGSKWAEF
jgi:hypothetical protein